jgi:hypothetical protein
VYQRDHWYQQEAFALPRALKLEGGRLGTVQVTIDGKIEVLRATFMSGAVEAMPL